MFYLSAIGGDLCNLDEPSSLVLLHIQVEPLALQDQSPRGEISLGPQGHLVTATVRARHPSVSPATTSLLSLSPALPSLSTIQQPYYQIFFSAQNMLLMKLSFDPNSRGKHVEFAIRWRSVVVQINAALHTHLSVLPGPGYVGQKTDC